MGSAISGLLQAISLGFLASIHPSVAALSGDFLVVWNELRNGSSAIYDTPVSSTGIARQPGGVAISRSLSNAWDPVLAAAAGRYWVAWEVNTQGAMKFTALL